MKLFNDNIPAGKKFINTVNLMAENLTTTKVYESQFHREVFNFWYGCDRSSTVTAEHFRIPTYDVSKFIRAFNWHERADEMDQKAAARAEKAAIDRKVKLIEDQREAGMRLRNIGIKYFEDNPDTAIKDAKEAMKAIEMGFGLERQAEGLPDWIARIVVMKDDEVKNRFHELDAELKRLNAQGVLPKDIADRINIDSAIIDDVKDLPIEIVIHPDGTQEETVISSPDNDLSTSQINNTIDHNKAVENILNLFRKINTDDDEDKEDSKDDDKKESSKSESSS